jgi:hypothetical protein
MPDPLLRAILLVPVGACVGFIGSLIGVGGGFFVVPFLLMVPLFPGAPFLPSEATAASLAIILLNAASATASNARRRRIDFRTGSALAAGTVPGAWFGRELVGRLKSSEFSAGFAVLLIGVAATVVFVKFREGKGRVRGVPREIVDSEGQAHRYEANLVLGFLASLGVGVIASLFGVGGGLLLVPFMVIVYGMPVLVATATSQFTFLFTASAGLLESLRRGHLGGAGLQVVLAMGLGAMLGARFGVGAAKRVRPSLVRAVLAAVLSAVAALMLLNSFSGRVQ